MEQKQTTIPVIKKSEIKNFKLSSGTVDLSFKMTNGKKWHMKLAIPELKEGEKAPLVIALHWAGGSNTYKEYSECLAFPAFKDLNAIIIAPSSDSSHWVEFSNEKRIIDLIKKVIKFWPIDSDKIIVTGYSNGGIGSWHYSKKYPKLFAASLPIAGYYGKDKLEVPQYVLHGQNDNLFKVEEVISSINSAIKKGSIINYKILKGYSHFMGCAYVEELKHMITIMKKERL